MRMQGFHELLISGWDLGVYGKRPTASLAGLTMDLRCVRVDRRRLYGVRMGEALSLSGIVEAGIFYVYVDLARQCARWDTQNCLSTKSELP